ncbi:BTAD domain-containing putative transcriptional regulator [Lentzea sp. NPDC004782]|uniref:AfsR/SARP family transcriptional regulator n=1 Tax=Lentzea sp. NPDC004782 TaxID=3154458 RepID=UPI00339FC39D
MRLRILGPVEIATGRGPALPARRMARVLLGTLALHANTFVPADRIVDALWGGCPPRSARINLRSYVSDLRRLLRSGGRDSTRIETANGGYLLAAEPDDLDVLAFTALAEAGRDCLSRGDYEQAVERLTCAGELWRGPVLDGVPVPEAVQPTVRMLEDRRVDAIEDCVQARLELGRHAGLAAELRELTGRYELRERLWGQLMLALYRSGRPGEAMRAYDRLRRVLDAELGADPSREIKQLYQRILRDDPRLAGPARIAAVLPRATPVPWQLPPDADPFVGRQDELRRLDHFTGAVAAVVGTAGVGKTALAVHWAHGVRSRFPDGCLYVDLRGYGPEPPVPPEQVLAGFLRVLGERATHIGHETAELSGRYRTLLADRRMLVVLDNARASDQVRPLLPGTAGCLVVVTSRDDLAGLVARDGAHRVRLDPMPPDQARVLLGRLVADQEGADAIVERCAGLPLALRIVAELAAQPGTSLAELADRQHDLDELDAGGDPSTAVVAVFDWSYRVLPPPAARAFGLLTWHPGAVFDEYAAAALLDTTPAEAGRLVGVLCRAHLVQRAGAGRYRIHDLLRAYGRRQPATDAVEAALTRLFDYYVHAATVAETMLPLGRGRPPHPAAFQTPPLHDPVLAAHWLNAERANLIAVIAHCATHGWHVQACELSQALRPYLDQGRHLAEAHTAHRHALHAARCLDDSGRIGAALNNLGCVYHHLGRYAEAIEHLEGALALRRQTGDRTGEARTINNLAGVYGRLGRHAEAGEAYRLSLHIARETGDLASEAMVLANLAFVHLRLGHYREAVDCHERALELAELLGDRMLESIEHSNLGLAYALLGRYHESAHSLRHAARLCRELGDHQGEAFVSGNLTVLHTRLGNHWVARRHAERALAVHSASGDLASEAAVLGYQGDLLLRMGLPAQALHSFRQALALDRRLGERFQEAQALNGIAAAATAMRRFDQAELHHDAALALATAIGDRYERARALDGIGHLRCGAGEAGAAAALWGEAAAIYAEIGVPEAEQLKARLQAITVPARLPSTVE